MRKWILEILVKWVRDLTYKDKGPYIVLESDKAFRIRSELRVPKDFSDQETQDRLTRNLATIMANQGFISFETIELPSYEGLELKKVIAIVNIIKPKQ